MSSIDAVRQLAADLTEQTERYRAERRALEVDKGLSPQGREAALSKLTKAHHATIEQINTQAVPMLTELERKNEERLRVRSRSADAASASTRVALALSTEHPSELVETYSRDHDTAALLALRQVVPSVVGKYAENRHDKAKFTDDMHRAIDRTLAETGDADVGRVAQERFALDAARDNFQGAIFYATKPDGHGALANALGQQAAGVEA